MPFVDPERARTLLGQRSHGNDIQIASEGRGDISRSWYNPNSSCVYPQRCSRQLIEIREGSNIARRGRIGGRVSRRVLVVCDTVLVDSILYEVLTKGGATKLAVVLNPEIEHK